MGATKNIFDELKNRNENKIIDREATLKQSPANMGVCLCKDSAIEDNTEDLSPVGDSCNLDEQSRVDCLVIETLQVIASIVDDEPDTPSSMLLLHDITDRPRGWLCLIRSLIRKVRLQI